MTLQTDGYDPSKSDMNAVFARLRRLKASLRFKVHKHDLAQVLIAEIISEGIDSGKRIVGVLRTLGLNAQHAGIMLKDGTGDDPAFYWWDIDADGHYFLLERSEPAA